MNDMVIVRYKPTGAELIRSRKEAADLMNSEPGAWEIVGKALGRN